MALTSKQRAMLRGLASKENVIVTVGKGGITENTVSEMNNALKARELVKGRVLETSLLSAREASETLCELCSAEAVQVIGNVFVLFRRNPQNPKIDLKKERKICRSQCLAAVLIRRIWAIEASWRWYRNIFSRICF